MTGYRIVVVTNPSRVTARAIHENSKKYRYEVYSQDDQRGEPLLTGYANTKWAARFWAKSGIKVMLRNQKIRSEPEQEVLNIYYRPRGM